MKLPGKNLIKKITPFFNLLAGKQGKKVAFGTAAAIALEGAGLGVGIAAFVGALPLTLAFSAIGPIGCGIGISIAVASSISARKTAKKEHKTLKEQGQTIQEVEELEKQILANQEAQQKPARPAAATAKTPTPG